MGLVLELKLNNNKRFEKTTTKASKTMPMFKIHSLTNWCKHRETYCSQYTKPTTRLHLSHSQQTLQNYKTQHYALQLATHLTLNIQHMHDKTNILPLETSRINQTKETNRIQQLQTHHTHQNT